MGEQDRSVLIHIENAFQATLLLLQETLPATTPGGDSDREGLSHALQTLAYLRNTYLEYLGE